MKIKVKDIVKITNGRLIAGDLILFKGSRGMHLEEVIKNVFLL